MTKRTLNAYRKLLSPAQVAEGISAARSNAKRLTEDAACLLDAGRYPTAGSIAILAIEEAGKASILRELALAGSESEAAGRWKRYRSHTSKNVTWVLPDLVLNGARKLDDFRPLFDADAEHSHLLDQVKQIGIYTDCLGNAHWSVPEAVISRELTQSLVSLARIMAQEGVCTTREIELWIQYLKPVWKQDQELMRQALVDWYSAMQTEGLHPPGSNLMQEFILVGLGTQTDRINVKNSD